MSHPSVAFFQEANNVYLENTTINSTVNIINNQFFGAYDYEFQELMHYCLLGALVDSNEQYDAPQCDEETMEAMIQQIDDWARNRTRRSSPLMWLRGGAGAGKSTLAQTIAMMYKRQGLLLGSFFFSNRRANRSNGNALILTLVLQMVIVFPAIRPFVLNEIKRNPTILSSSPEEHMQHLLVRPLNSLATTISDPQPTLIVIDGLDECENTATQTRLIRIITSALPQLHHPLRFLISSRPEAHITRAFEKDPALPTLPAEQLDLSAARDADQDIERYLRRQFTLIRQSHPFGEHLPNDWPSDNIIRHLVRQSSGHFIYPSTILKFVDDPNDFPDQRLEAALDSTQLVSTDDPLAPLDVLYRHILSGINNRHLPVVQRVLSLLYLNNYFRIFPSRPRWRLDRDNLDMILQLKKGYIDVVLQPLRSLVDVGSYQTRDQDPGRSIRIFHASFFDFLSDPQRSTKFQINIGLAHKEIAHYVIRSAFDTLSELEISNPKIFFEDFLRHSLNAVISDNVLHTYLRTCAFLYEHVLPHVTTAESIHDITLDFLQLLSRKDIDPTGQLRVEHLQKMAKALSVPRWDWAELPYTFDVGSPTCSTDQVNKRLSHHNDTDILAVLNLIRSLLACWHPNISFLGRHVHPAKDKIISLEQRLFKYGDTAHSISCGPLQHLVQHLGRDFVPHPFVDGYADRVIRVTIVTHDPTGRSFQSTFATNDLAQIVQLVQMTRKHILKCEALFRLGDEAPWSVNFTSWNAPSTSELLPKVNT